MILNVKSINCFLLFLFISQTAFSELQLQEVRTASNSVIVLFFIADTVNINEIKIENKSDWKVNGEPVKNISRYVTQADACDFHIYICNISRRGWPLVRE